MVQAEGKSSLKANKSNLSEADRPRGDILEVPRGESFSIRVSVKPGEKWVEDSGYDVAWVRVYFKPDRGPAHEVGNFELTNGSGGSPVTMGQNVVFEMLIHEPGELLVLTYSLAEGLVLNSRRFEVLD